MELPSVEAFGRLTPKTRPISQPRIKLPRSGVLLASRPPDTHDVFDEMLERDAPVRTGESVETAEKATAAEPGQERAPYFEALRAYADRDPGRYHVPGHKGGVGTDPELREALGDGALALDIPLII